METLSIFGYFFSFARTIYTKKNYAIILSD